MNATTPAPTAADEAQARAYLHGVVCGFAITLDDWTGLPDGTATFTDDEGTTLLFTGAEQPFDALVYCRHHRLHRAAVTYPDDLDQVRADTADCTAQAQPVMPRLAETPTPLWLITRATGTPGQDRHTPRSTP
ncbi:hypothetical protein [Streptomyces sp. YIM S03343]